ncbi:hypothetical protein LVY72_14015 [Arthrobacter sp. I2-34]|uniref:Centromere-binding protein ParB C-terminal domain-containing protein n=1 Tax=Arthrobacter hankyongi TaxID=2904801 RepID=A0ABS9L8L8_9MICC|nr:hypothetical protein [Arthrobacter hankyongi]MCG2623014.1 hypothetical protein [Arthrobacter hankyongi]
MSPAQPPVARGGSDNPLAKFKRGGLKKAAGSSVVAEMISSPQPEQPAAVVPAPQPPVQAADAAPAAAPASNAAPASEPAPSVSATVLAESPPVPGPEALRPGPETPQAREEQAPTRPSPQPVQAPPHSQVDVPAKVSPSGQYDAAAIAGAHLPPAQPIQPAAAGYLQPVQAPVPQYAPPVAAPVQQPFPAAVPQYEQPVTAQAPAAVPEQPAPPKSKKTSFHQPVGSGDRMRSTYNATRHLTKYLTMSEFICAAVDKMCAELEEKYNDGERFDADPGAVPKGRPVGS